MARGFKCEGGGSEVWLDIVLSGDKLCHAGKHVEKG